MNTVAALASLSIGVFANGYGNNGGFGGHHGAANGYNGYGGWAYGGYSYDTQPWKALKSVGDRELFQPKCDPEDTVELFAQLTSRLAPAHAGCSTEDLLSFFFPADEIFPPQEGGVAQFASYGRDIRDLNDAFEQLWVTRNIDWYLQIKASNGKSLYTGRGKAAEELWGQYTSNFLDLANEVIGNEFIPQNDDGAPDDVPPPPPFDGELELELLGLDLDLNNCIARRGNPECAYQVDCMVEKRALVADCSNLATQTIATIGSGISNLIVDALPGASTISFCMSEECRIRGASLQLDALESWVVETLKEGKRNQATDEYFNIGD